MRKTIITLTLSLLLLFSLSSCNQENPYSSRGGVQKDNSKWNVMIYLCGSNLEEQSRCATYNLEEIAKTIPSTDVNVYIMTGGVRDILFYGGWHTSLSTVEAVHAMNLTSSTNGGHQYWKYKMGTSGKGEFVEWFPESRSMNNPSELQAFVTYCNSDAPHRKNLLCLWDHGGGLSGGLIADFTDTSSSDQTMTLSQMGLALKNSGVHFDAVLMDLCLMQSLETGLVLCDSADYMIGSQDDVPGEGTAYTKWLQYLYDNPGCTPLAFGKKVCDFQMEKYAGEYDKTSFSVIDLNYIKELASYTDAIYKSTVETLYNFLSKKDLAKNLSVLKTVHNFSLDSLGMYDLSSAASAFYDADYLSEEEYYHIDDILSKAIVYNRTGSLNQYANGLSFYYALSDASYTNDVEQYLENFASATPYFKLFMETKFQESRSALSLSTETDLISYYNQAIPYYLKLETTQKKGLIESVYLLFMERDITLEHESYLYSGTFCDVSQLTFTPYNLNKDEFYMPALVVETSGCTSCTNIYTTSNYEYKKDSQGYYERYLIPMISTDYFNTYYLIIIKDCDTNKYSFYLYNGSSNSAVDSRYQYTVPISNISGSAQVYFMIADTGRCYYQNGTPFTLDNTTKFALTSVPASEYIPSHTVTSGTDLVTYYKTFRYIVNDIFGNSIMINPDRTKFQNSTIID